MACTASCAQRSWAPGTDARWTLEILLGILASQQNGHNRVDLPLPRNGS